MPQLTSAPTGEVTILRTWQTAQPMLSNNWEPRTIWALGVALVSAPGPRGGAFVALMNRVNASMSFSSSSLPGTSSHILVISFGKRRLVMPISLR